MRSKRRLWWLALVAVVLGLGILAAGCGGDEAAPPAEPPAEEPPAEPPAEGIKVGLVTDTGGVDDRGFNEFSIAGMERAAADFGLETRIYVSNTAADYLPNLTAAATDGNDLVLGVGFLLTPDLITVAAEFPDTQFAGVDHFYGTEGSGDGCEGPPRTCALPNTLGMLYPTEEAGYLAGIVAAMMTESGIVATTGGKKIPPVDNWIAGFQQAILDTNPDIEFLNAYSDDFDDQAKCAEITLDQINQGADIIFQVAGKCGLGSLDAAGQSGVFAIGVDADQAFAGPHILTSALKPLEGSVYEVIKSFVEGAFQGGQNIVLGIEALPDSPLLAPFSGDVPQEVQDAVAEAAAKLASGEIDPPAALEEVG